MICKYCNAQIADDYMFCSSCGRKVEVKPVAAPAPTGSSAFRQAGNIDGSDSEIGVPVAQRISAPPNEDTGLRFSSSFKRKSEPSAVHISPVEKPVSIGGTVGTHHDTNKNVEVGSPSTSVPKIDHSAAVGIPGGNTSVCTPLNAQSGYISQGAHYSAEQMRLDREPGKRSVGKHFETGTQPPTKKIGKKVSLTVYICAGVLAVLAILISVFFITKAQSPWFELNSAGKLSFDLDTWKFYHFYESNSSVEIPQKYDGAIQSISPNTDLQYRTLRYEGYLEEFLAEHPWAITMIRNRGYGKVKCWDYTFAFDESGLGMDIVYDENDGPHYTRGNYSISNRSGNSILFESWRQMRRWLDTGIYEFSWTDFYGKTHYEEVRITLD